MLDVSDQTSDSRDGSYLDAVRAVMKGQWRQLALKSTVCAFRVPGVAWSFTSLTVVRLSRRCNNILQASGAKAESRLYSHVLIFLDPLRSDLSS